jgi:hypothetical protein
VISPATITITSGDAASSANADILTSRDASTANGSLANTLTLQQAQELQNKLNEQQENQRLADLVGAVAMGVIGEFHRARNGRMAPARSWRCTALRDWCRPNSAEAMPWRGRSRAWRKSSSPLTWATT